MLGFWKRFGAAWAGFLPLFLLWVLVAKSSAQLSLREALTSGATSMGTALGLGFLVWTTCRQWPWPLHASPFFYTLQVLFSICYALLWNVLICVSESLRRGTNVFPYYWTSRTLGWQLLMGVFIYGVFAGYSYSVQTRTRLHEKELLASRAEALAATARMEAIRARLNPHFLFNALHTLAALSKFKPTVAEDAFERLGDMLRYTLKEDKRQLVDFADEYDFTRQYIAFEQLRYEGRLHVEFQIDPNSFNFDVPPFSLQTLAENAVRHAISVRPEGGSIWIKSECSADRLVLSVRDDGPGEHNIEGKSHQFGLRSLRERLEISFGQEARLATRRSSEGFEAIFEVPGCTKEGGEGDDQHG
jgi:two-component system LytT family sensor kinase